MARFDDEEDDDLDFEDDDFFSESESDDDEDEESEDSDEVSLDNLQELLEEGLEPRKPKRNMNPRSIANLKRGGVENHIKKDKISKRETEILRRVAKMNEDPLDYYRHALTRNLVQEEFNLEELQNDLATENVKSNQQRIRAMIYTTTQSLLLLGDALKAQPKQNKIEDKKSLSALAQMFEEFRKTLPPEHANHADKFREQLEQMREEYKENLEKGETR